MILLMDYQVFPRDEKTLALMFNIVSAVKDLRAYILDYNEEVSEFSPDKTIDSEDVVRVLKNIGVENAYHDPKFDLGTVASEKILDELFKIKEFTQFSAAMDMFNLDTATKYEILRNNLLKVNQPVESMIELYAPASVDREKFIGKNGLDLDAD